MPAKKVTASSIFEEIEITDQEFLLKLIGSNDSNLKNIRKAYGVKIWLKGQTIQITGEKENVDKALALVVELVRLNEGGDLDNITIDQHIHLFKDNTSTKVDEFKTSPHIIKTKKKTIAPKSQVQQEYIKAMRSNDLTFGVGSAGTGKTFLAMAMAVEMLLNNQYDKIILTRPAVEAGEKLGFLPGDLAEKVNPYLRPLYDALDEMVDKEKAAELILKGTIEVAPLAFMRGRDLKRSFIILDEAQNTTREQMKMFLTRIGFGSKAVITGDGSQVDLPRGERSGLADALVILKDIQEIHVSRFSDVDVVRHPLVRKIVRAYDEAEDKKL